MGQQRPTTSRRPYQGDRGVEAYRFPTQADDALGIRPGLRCSQEGQEDQRRQRGYDPYSIIDKTTITTITITTTIDYHYDNYQYYYP